jgi:hypothetical protein
MKRYLSLEMITLIVGYEKYILLKEKITKDYLAYLKKLSINH